MLKDFPRQKGEEKKGMKNLLVRVDYFRYDLFPSGVGRNLVLTR